jgi:hypothetical protein
MSAFQRKYNASATINFPLITADDTTFISSVSWGSTDIKIIKDEGTEADATNDPVHEGSGMWSLAITATELSAARVTVTIKNAAIEDQALLIETYGHASAQHAFDLDAAIVTAAVGTGGIASTSFGANSITASAIAADAVAELSEDADDQFAATKIVAGSTDRYIYFIGKDSATNDRKTGLTGFAVYSSVDGDPPVSWTTPTVNETDSTNMPGVYELLVDEDTSIASDHDSEEMSLHITASGMKPVTRIVDLYRVKATEGITIGAILGGYAAANVARVDGVALDTHDSGKFPSDIRMVEGVALSTHVAGQVPADTLSYAGKTATTSTTNQKPDVNIFCIDDDASRATDLKNNIVNMDAAVSATATPTEVGTELATIGLDHLITAADPGGLVVDDSILAKLVSKSATASFSDFDNTTDSLQAQADAGIKAEWFIETTVSDVSPTTTGFDLATGLSSGANFYRRSTLVFTNGNCKGQQRVISTSSGGGGSVTSVTFDGQAIHVDGPWPVAPANGDACTIVGRG